MREIRKPWRTWLYVDTGKGGDDFAIILEAEPGESLAEFEARVARYEEGPPTVPVLADRIKRLVRVQLSPGEVRNKEGKVVGTFQRTITGTLDIFDFLTGGDGS